jgi:hypothetical protein
MRGKLFPALLIAALTLLLALVVACGDDDDDDDDGGTEPTGSPEAGEELTLDEYLAEVNEIQEGVTQATDAVGENAQDAFSDPTAARQALTSASQIGEAAVTSLQALTPPAEAQDAHDGLISAGENLVSEVDTLSTDLQAIEPGAEFDEWAADAQAPDSELSQAINGMADACEEVAGLGDVDLSCPAKVE